MDPSKCEYLLKFACCIPPSRQFDHKFPIWQTMMDRLQERSLAMART